METESLFQNFNPHASLRSTERSCNRVMHKKFETCESIYVCIVDTNLGPQKILQGQNSSGGE